MIHYDTVFLYEINETTIGIAVDTDHNGTYETNLLTGASVDLRLLGDINGDESVMIIDATYIQRNVASIDIPFDCSKDIADVDGDGDVALMDATYIQKWLANINLINNIGKPIKK